MPILNFTCQTDGPYTAYRSVHEDAVPPCPTCQVPGETDWGVWRNESRCNPTPVVIFQAADGSFRFPGSADGAYAQKCASEGMTRVELRGWADVRRFEGRVNQQEQSKINRRVERQQAALAQGESIRRSELFNGMRNGFQIPDVDPSTGNRTGRMKTVHLSARSKDVADRLIELGNRKRVHSYEPGFHVDAYSYDRSNRDESRDPRGQRRRD